MSFSTLSFSFSPTRFGNALGQDFYGSDGTWPYYRTALRVNPKRQHDYTVLVAMDLRQLQLNMVAGVANPTSTTGTRRPMQWELLTGLK